MDATYPECETTARSSSRSALTVDCPRSAVKKISGSEPIAPSACIDAKDISPREVLSKEIKRGAGFMPELKSIADVVSLISASRTAIKTAAHRHNIGHFCNGKIAGFTEEEAQCLRSLIRTNPGNPDFGTKRKLGSGKSKS